jgi:hypothetical protein
MKPLLSSAIASLAILCCLQACEPALKVTSDYDKAVDFSRYKTYVIDTFTLPQRMNALNANRVLNAVKADLNKKGFTESGTPDLAIHIAVIAKDAQTVTATSSYYGYGGYYRPYYWGGTAGGMGYTTYDVHNYVDGSLIVDVADAHTRQLLWEGIGNKEIGTPSDPEAAINDAVTKIMASFPPKPAATKK